MFKKGVVFVMVLGVFLTFSVMAQVAPENDFQVELSKDGTYCLVIGYTGHSENIVVPSTIEGFSVKEIGNSAFYKHNNITSVELPNSVEKIGSSAFEECTSLQSIALSDFLECIDRNAFKKCNSLRSIELPNSLAMIRIGAFAETPNLREVKFPTNSSISIEEYAFIECGMTEFIINSNMHFAKTIYVAEIKNNYNKARFHGLNDLQNIIIEADVESLPEYLLSSPSLRTITFKSPNTIIKKSTFIACPNLTLAVQVEIRKHIK